MPKKKQTAKTCYVIMPFSKTKTCTEDEWTDIFESIIKPAVEGGGLGYRCLRSEATTGNIIKKVVNSLYQANVVVADLTDRNPNVFYELGVRHTLKNRTIIIAQRRKDIPSDLDGYASHVYRWKTTGQRDAFTKKLRDLLRSIESDTDRSDNPVSDFLDETSTSIFEFRKEENLRKLRALVDEVSRVISVLRSYLDSAKDKPEDEKVGLGYFHPCPSIDQLIATQYIYNKDLSEQASAMRAGLAIVGQLRPAKKIMSRAVEDLATFQRNVEKAVAAYEAGDPLDELQLEELPSRQD